MGTFFFIVFLAIVGIAVAVKAAAKSPTIRGEAGKAAATYLIGKFIKR